MRPKTLKLVVTFHTTAAAMAMETLCKAQSIPGRLIPTPRELTADCGMAWCAPLDAGDLLLLGLLYFLFREKADEELLVALGLLLIL